MQLKITRPPREKKSTSFASLCSPFQLATQGRVHRAGKKLDRNLNGFVMLEVTFSRKISTICRRKLSFW